MILLNKEFSAIRPASSDLTLALSNVTNLAKGKNSLVLRSTTSDSLFLENV